MIGHAPVPGHIPIKGSCSKHEPFFIGQEILRDRHQPPNCDLKAADFQNAVKQTPAVKQTLPTDGLDPLLLNNRNARELLALNILKKRRTQGMSQEMLAHSAGLHRTFIAHVESQKRNISLDNLERIAIALGAAPYELLLPINESGRA